MTLTKNTIAIFLIFALTVACYSLGMPGAFLLDDFENFKRLEFVDGRANGYLLAIFNNTGEIFNRPISYASFLLNLDDWPNNPAGFKKVNLVLHLLSGLTLFLCLRRIPYGNEKTKRIFETLVVGFWMLSPLSVSTVLYSVQRMTILSSFFGLIAIYFYLLARTGKSQRVSLEWLVLSGISIVLSFLSKENGILIIPLIGLLHVCLRSEKQVIPSPKWLDGLIIAGVLVFIGLMIYLLFDALPGYSSRPFTVIERLLLEGRILFDYIYLSFIPNVSYMSLHHDGYEYFSKSSLIFGGILWIVHILIICFAVRLWNKYRLASIGILWFYVGHTLESTYLALELMFEHRNYFPSIGLYVLPSLIIARYGSRLQFPTAWVKPLMLSVPLVVFALLLAYRSALWSEHSQLAVKWAAFKKDSPRAQYVFAGQLDQAGFKLMAYDKILESAERFDRLGFYLYAWRLQCSLGSEAIQAKLEFPSSHEIRNMYHSSEVSHELGKLLDHWLDQECVPEGYTYDLVDAFLESVLAMRRLENKPSYKAQILVTIGKFYSKLGNFDKAAQSWRELYQIQPSIDNALRNVDFALQFALYEYAEEYLEKAKKLNRQLPWIAADQNLLLQEYAIRIDRAKKSADLKQGS